jgi:hypothetical protein
LRHAAVGLYLEGELESFQEWIRVWEQETVETGSEWVEEELEQVVEGAGIRGRPIGTAIAIISTLHPFCLPWS